MTRLRLVAVLGVVIIVLAGGSARRYIGPNSGASHPAVAMEIVGPNAATQVVGETLSNGSASDPPGSPVGPKASTSTPPPAPGSPAPTNPGQAVIEWVDTQLKGTAPTGDKKTDKDISDAATALDRSLAGYWSADGNHVASKGGNVVFDQAKAAISDLLKIKTPPAPPPGPPKPPGKPGSSGVYADYINDLDFAMWLVGNTAIGDNSCDPAKPNELTTANNELVAGNKQFDQGQFDEALDHYKNAWAHAISAGGTSCTASFSVGGNITGLYPGSTLALPIVVTNPNSFDIQVTALSVGVGNASVTCLASNLQLLGSVSGPITVTHNSSVSLPSTFSLQMIASPDNSCQGASFPLTYSGSAVHP